ncbi:hypothetical protein SDC9_134891 [bioreactor metagenome]|uniref:Uncharacterized protein n=1 Tax=bioreactor metagenome TaxID=1076179 RepID=A0A645DEW7_9ZZZZ
MLLPENSAIFKEIGANRCFLGAWNVIIAPKSLSPGIKVCVILARSGENLDVDELRSS